MKWMLILLICFGKVHAQKELYGDWYNIGTERLVHFRFDKDTIHWTEETFLFGPAEGKEPGDIIISKTVYDKNLFCLVHENDVSSLSTFSVTFLRYNSSRGYLDLMMSCTYADTSAISAIFKTCDTSSKMIMRFYNRDTIEKYRVLKSVDKMPKNELAKANQLFKKKGDALIKKFGEDSLLWVAPILFQQVLTDILLDMGYNPMLSEKQANDLFAFNFY